MDQYFIRPCQPLPTPTPKASLLWFNGTCSAFCAQNSFAFTGVLSIHISGRSQKDFRTYYPHFSIGQMEIQTQDIWIGSSNVTFAPLCRLFFREWSQESQKKTFKMKKDRSIGIFFPSDDDHYWKISFPEFFCRFIQRATLRSRSWSMVRSRRSSTARTWRPWWRNFSNLRSKSLSPVFFGGGAYSSE